MYTPCKPHFFLLKLGLKVFVCVCVGGGGGRALTAWTCERNASKGGHTQIQWKEFYCLLYIKINEIWKNITKI